MVNREEVLNGTLVTLFRQDGQPEFGYSLDNCIYVFDYRKEPINYNESEETYIQWYEGGDRFMDYIRLKRKNAKTPYSKRPLQIENLTPRLVEALRFVKKSGGATSGKMLSDHFGISPQAAKRLMSQMVNEAILSLDERAAAGYLMNAADNVEFDK